MNVFLVLIAFACIAAMDLPNMVKSRQWRALTIYSIIFVCVLALGLVIALGVKIPSTVKIIQAFYRDVLGLSFKVS